MNEYSCKICNYITNERSNLNRHNKSARHVKKVTENHNNVNKLNEFQTITKLQQKLHRNSTVTPP